MLEVPKYAVVNWSDMTGGRWDAEYQIVRQKYGDAAKELLKKVTVDGIVRRFSLLRTAAELPFDSQAMCRVIRGTIQKSVRSELSRLKDFELALYLVLASDQVQKMATQADNLIRKSVRVRRAAGRIGLLVES